MSPVFFHIRRAIKKGMWESTDLRNHTVALSTNRPIRENGTIPLQLFIKVGISTVHPEDNYNKKTGREIATKRMMFENFNLVSFGSYYISEHIQVAIYQTVISGNKITLIVDVNRGIIIEVEVFKEGRSLCEI